MRVKQRWSNVTVVTPAEQAAADLLIDGDRFAGVVPAETVVGDDWQAIDGKGAVLFPGIIDLLQHGYGTRLYNDTEQGAVAENSLALLARGVTGFLPSISCLPPGTMEGVLSRLAAQCGEAKGARALGVHSEGPCFGSPGAHNPENIVAPSIELAERMLAATEGTLKAVTVAPEREGAEGFIRTLKRAGVSIHLGHSQARPENVSRYVGWGLDAVTHMYNVMPTYPPGGMGVHTVSLTDALLAEPTLALGLICDGIHVDRQLIRLLAQLPADRVFLETDAMKYAGTPGRKFEFYPGYWVESVPGKAVRDENGGLCGSSLTPDEAMRNYLRFSGRDLVRAAHAASLVPARVIGMAADIGSIERGKRADFAVLDPATLEVRATYLDGRCVHGSAS
ncbi:amidohydrolase family protein [Kaistia dalseonensis]|uniref:N-acetylglucosamine-6-phosphate deacetylase n=1 Tax=Kaistia dalseonensis TaxID=410840 RepID=A0ABU0H5L7_9HYPH|nr:amidohydrolase family protein [Kaistia dalseonensis]MCX5494741.1 amidohydrolase family protein [Kaistia dalseonensis]MDQ0437322.1 N-acetylglucosamine-6-phosphate deacetylase [Kaistia dalseonensis]